MMEGAGCWVTDGEIPNDKFQILKRKYEIRNHKSQIANRSDSWGAAPIAVRDDAADSIVRYGRRQHEGLQGPASGGGHEFAIGRLAALLTRPTDALICFCSLVDSQPGQTAVSFAPINSSNSLLQDSQMNSKIGIAGSSHCLRRMLSEQRQL